MSHVTKKQKKDKLRYKMGLARTKLARLLAEYGKTPDDIEPYFRGESTYLIHRRNLRGQIKNMEKAIEAMSKKLDELEATAPCLN